MENILAEWDAEEVKFLQKEVRANCFELHHAQCVIKGKNDVIKELKRKLEDASQQILQLNQVVPEAGLPIPTLPGEEPVGVMEVVNEGDIPAVVAPNVANQNGIPANRGRVYPKLTDPLNENASSSRVNNPVNSRSPLGRVRHSPRIAERMEREKAVQFGGKRDS